MSLLQRALSVKLRFTLYGVLFGLMFPGLAFLWLAVFELKLLSSAFLARAHREFPLLYMIDSAPLFLGLLAYLAGMSEEKLQRLNDQLKAEVRERTRELRLLAVTFETGLAAMITDADGTIVRVNESFCRITGYRPEEVLGRNPRMFQSRLHDSASYEEMWRALKEDGHWHGEIWNRYKGGKVLPMFESITAVYDNGNAPSYYVAVSYDITEQKQLEASRNRLLEILENTPDFIAMTEPDGTLLYINRGGRALMGLATVDNPLEAGDLEPLEGGRFGHPDWAARLVREEGFPAAMRDGIWQGETAMINADGEEVPMSQIILSHYDETGRVTHLSTIMRDISELKRLEAELHNQADRDSLTGLYNRRRFEHFVEDEIYRAGRYDRPFALVVFDIDHFKQINDGYSHEAGDRVLIQLAGILNHEMRQSDIVCRWGGDEFLILLPETGPDAAMHVADNLRRIISEERFAGPGTVTISVGVACYNNGVSFDQLLRQADDALYRAKESGRNKVALHDD